MKLSNLKILLAERDQFITDAFQKFFKSKGCYLVTAGSTGEGIRLLIEENFDVIVCEYELPEVGGLEFIEYAANYNPNAIKMIITSYGQYDFVLERHKSLVDDVIEKPFSIKRFLKIISRHLNKQAERSEIASLTTQKG